MNQTYQNFISVLATQPTSKLGFIKLIMILEFIQNIGLSLPKHGWQKLQYDEKMIYSIQQITNYTLFLKNNSTEYILEASIILISAFYFLFIGICVLFPQQQKISIIGNITLTLLQKIGRIPLTIIYFDFLRQNQSNFGWIFITVTIFIISLILNILTTYFQRDMQINLSREFYPINQQFIQLIYFIYIMDILRIIVFIFLNNQTGFILFSVLSILIFFIKLYINLFQQNDPDGFNQSLILCNLSIQVFLLITISNDIQEILIFNLLLYFITLIFHISSKIDFKIIIRTEKNIINSIQNQIKNNLNLLLMQKRNYKYDDTYYINFIKGIIDEEIKFNRYFQNENNVLILFEYLTKKQQSYYQALFIINKFECQQSKLSLYYQLMSIYYKNSIQNDIRQINKSGLIIQQLNKDILFEVEYQRRFKEILQKQIDFLVYLIGGSKSFSELEQNIKKISRLIESTMNWLELNKILNNTTNFIYLKISINFNTYIMLYPQALKLKQIMKSMLTNDHKTIEAIQLMRSKAVVITVSLIKQKGVILNVNKQVLQFFGLTSFDYKLEFLEQLMPEALQPYHSLFIERYLNRHSLKNNQQKSLDVIQQQENGTLQCLEVSFTISNDKSDFILISLLKKVNQERGYIIFDNSGRITGMSEQIQEMKELYSQMKNYSYIQYFCTDLHFILNNKEFTLEKEINLFQRVNISNIDKQFRNFLSQQNKGNHMHIPSNFEYLTSDRSEKYQLLNSKNTYLEHEIILFDIQDSEYQEKLNQIINLNITEQDIFIKCKAKLSKIVYQDEIIQYQLEIIPLEIKVQHEDEEILHDQILQIENIKAKSMNDVSIVSSEQKASYFLHDILLKQQQSKIIFKIYTLKSILILLIMIFITVSLIQLEIDFDTKIKYTEYLNAPSIISNFYNSAFSYGFYKILYEKLDQSEYFINSFNNFTIHQMYTLRNNFQILYENLVKIINEGYTSEFNIQYLQIKIISDDLTNFSNIVRENFVILLTYPQNSLRFIKATLFFRQNLVSSYQLTLKLIESFSALLTDYSLNFLVFWQNILIIQIIFYIIPFIINIKNWLNLEKRHKYILQIMSRLNEDQATKLIEIKQQLINFFDSEKQQQISMNQSYYTCKSPGRILHTTVNTSYQNLRHRDNQLLFEKIQNKSISILSKLIISFLFYIMLVIFTSISYIQINQDDTAQLPVENLLKSYIKFQSQLNYLISMTSIMNGQQIFYNQIKDIQDPEIGNISNIFNNDTIPKYFQNVSQSYSKKIISLFSTVVLSDNIDEASKTELYKLYKDDFCYYMVDLLPFCNSNLNFSQFQYQYGQFNYYENNSEILSRGIIGYISKLDSLIKNDFDVELQTLKYQKNQTTLFYQKDFNNLIIQYMFNITDGFQLFYEKVNSISINLNLNAQSSLRIYFLSFGFSFMFLYLLASFIQINLAQKRYKSCVIGLVTLSDDLLNDKTNLNFLKKLSR